MPHTLNAAHAIAALEQLMPECRRFLHELVELNSFTRNREGVNANAERIIARFAEFGFSIQRHASPVPGGGEHLVLDSGHGEEKPTIALISHLDTVYPEEEEKRNDFVWKQHQGSIVSGPGVFDIKGGTAMIWLLLKAMAEVSPDLFRAFRWLLLFNAAEEELIPQFGDLCHKVLPRNTKACLVFEGDSSSEGGHYRIVHGRKGRCSISIRVHGRGAHAGGSHAAGANAIRQLARLVERAEALTDHRRELTVNVGVISGGSVINRVPHEAEAALEIRAYEQAALRETREAIVAMAGEGDLAAVRDGHPCRVEVIVHEEIAPWQPGAAAGSATIAALWSEAAAACGQSLEAVVRGGLSDGNWLATSFPTLDGLGPCGGNAHCSESSEDGSKVAEYADMGSFVPKTLINLAAVHALWRQGAVLPKAP